MRNIAFLSFILAGLVLTSTTALEQKQGLPIIFFHGLGSSCHIDEKGAAYKAMRDGSPYKNPIYCVEYGALVNSVLQSINFHCKKACRELERLSGKYNLENGYILFGSSQGGMISRYILQECSMGKYVKGFISSGGPQMGVIRWPHTDFEKYEKFINEITEDIAYTPLV
jgi:hypothetical protein